MAFASTTLAAKAGAPSTNKHANRDSARIDMRALFDEMDTNRDGLVGEKELLEFTAKRYLPSSYVKEFIAGARKHTADARGPLDVIAQLRQSGRASSSASDGLRFHEFAAFIGTKEAALRQSFDRIDTDRDGYISVEDLMRALDDVRVCRYRQASWCKKVLGMDCDKTTRCRVKKSQVNCMLAAMDVRDAKTGKVTHRKRKNAHCADADGKKRLMDYTKFRDFFVVLPDTALLFDYWMDSTCTTFRGCDIGCSVQLANKQSPAVGAVDPWRHLGAGALAGAVSRTLTAPIETLRLRMMVSGVAAGGATHQLAGLLADAKRTHGAALFAGNGANVARSAPAKGIDFFAFSLYKSALKRAFSDGTNGKALQGRYESMQILAAGALAGATSNLALYPLELARSRLATTDTYKGIGDCMGQIVKNHGVRGLYSGLKPSMLGIIPEAAITYGCFDLLKQGYAKVAGIPEEEVGSTPAMLCGMASAFTGQFVAYPLEVVARRMQVSDATSVGRLTGVVRSMRHLVATEGLGSLYCGIVPACVKVLPMAAASFGTYELVNSLLSAQQQRAGGSSSSSGRAAAAAPAQPSACGSGGCAGCVGGCAGCGAAERPSERRGGGGGGGGGEETAEFCTTDGVREKQNCAPGR